MDSLRVLLVDDEQDIVDTIKYSLELRGYVVDVAYDGLTALSMGRRGRYTIMVLDVMLPGKNGYEVSRILKEEMEEGDLILTLGAGSVTSLSDRLVETVRDRGK